MALMHKHLDTAPPRPEQLLRARSWLCSSSLKHNLVAKALQVGADVAHFDLEDSVPAPLKGAARSALARQFKRPIKLPTAIRLNSVTSPDGLRDLLFLLEHRIGADVVILPKFSLASDLPVTARVLLEHFPQTKVFGIVEMAQTLHELRSVSVAPPGLAGLIFGAADFANDLGVELETANWSYVKYDIALTARRLGLQAIDSPCFQLDDPARLEAELTEAKQLGFAGKIAIHPSQVATINAFFSPSPKAELKARRLIRLHERATSAGIVTLDQQMVGPPFVKSARRLLSVAAGLRGARRTQSR